VTLGGRIALARESAGLSGAELASRLGVMSKTVRNWETDRSEPRGNKLATLSGILGVSLTWLASGIDENPVDHGALEETKSLQVKLDQLLNLHEQSATLVADLQSDIQKLQDRIDRDDIYT